MIKGLKDAQIADGLPRVLGEQPWVRALSLAMLELHRKTMDYINGSQIYTAIDTVSEEVLDALAVNWKIDWYDTDYDIEQKRRIVKTALNIRRTMGTAGAARTQADAIYPGTKLEEWFEYGGTHGRVNVSQAITVSCNYFFYECGSRLGETRLYQYAAAFGLTSKTGIDLPGEVRSVVGSQNTLYDPTKPVGESSQDTSRPIIVFNSIKSHLKKCGESRGMEYDDERLSSCAKRLMDMAVAYPESSWVENMRTILMEELNMPRSMVYSNSVITDTYNYINDIKWGGSQTILTAIGQSVTTVTPIAVARYVTAVANGGKVYNVSIVDSIISPEGEVLSRRDPVLINDLNDTNGYFNLIHKGMKGVTDDTGTAKRYWSDFKWQKKMGAKTGTAQVNQIDLENNGWFVCFAPLDNPKVAIVVYVPHGYSGAMCSYAAKDFLNWIFPEWDKSDVDYDLPIGNSLAP